MTESEEMSNSESEKMTSLGWECQQWGYFRVDHVKDVVYQVRKCYVESEVIGLVPVSLLFIWEKSKTEWVYRGAAKYPWEAAALVFFDEDMYSSGRVKRRLRIDKVG